MNHSLILSDFMPVQIGKMFNQQQLNHYFKYVFLKALTAHSRPLVAAGLDESLLGYHPQETYEQIRNMVDRYAIGPEFIGQRQVCIFDDVEQVVRSLETDNDMNLQLPSFLDVLDENPYGLSIKDRMKYFNKVAYKVFEKVYDNEENVPNDIVHVTCSGYASPSVAQQYAANRYWGDTNVTHSYQMGCYGAFPGIRIGGGIMAGSYFMNPVRKQRVDIVHTELLSIHLNLTEHTPANTVISSLFADGFIKYSLYSSESFPQDKAGLKILASHEVLIPESLDDMTWDICNHNFEMFLSKRVPVFIRGVIYNFVSDLCKKVGIDFATEKDDLIFAIHPGGPKIVEYIVNELKLKAEQASWAFDVLKKHGNMSSATVPHILNNILESDSVPKGKKIIAVAFGPGLTATSLLFEKI